jgi:serine/threonine protein kinase
MEEYQNKVLYSILEENLIKSTDIIDIKTIQSRVGSIYKVKIKENQNLLVKMDSTNNLGEENLHRIKTLKKEFQIIKKYKRASYRYLREGITNNHYWIIRDWIEGVNPYRLIGNRNVKDLNLYISTIISMIDEINNLIECGYLHGDLQPSHFIFDLKGNCHLIDLEQAYCLKGANNNYNGALVHFVSPETAAEMLLKNKDIKLTITSEIYSFGSVCYFLYTGKVPYDYEGETFNEKLKIIKNGFPITFNGTECGGVKEFQKIIHRCLNIDPENRYKDFNELRDELIKIVK